MIINKKNVFPRVKERKNQNSSTVEADYEQWYIIYLLFIYIRNNALVERVYIQNLKEVCLTEILSTGVVWQLYDLKYSYAFIIHLLFTSNYDLFLHKLAAVTGSELQTLNDGEFLGRILIYFIFLIAGRQRE